MALDLAILIQLIERDGDAVSGEEFHHFQMALGNGTGLVAEQNVQRACGFNAFCLTYQNVVVQHLAGVLHQNQRDHQRQTFGNCTNDDNDCQRHCFHNVLDDGGDVLCKVSCKAAAAQNEVAEVHHGNDDCADVAEGRDLVCQLGELDLQRGVRFVALHFLCHLAHHGCQTDLLHLQNAFAVKNHNASEQGVLINEGVAGDFLCQHHLFGCCKLLAFFGFTVEGGVVDLQCAINENTVSGYLVAGLQQNQIAHNHVVHVDDGDHAVAVNLAFVLLGAVLQLSVLGVAGDAGLCGNKGNDQNRNNGTDRLINIGVTENPHADHQRCDGQQDLDHGVAEGFQKCFPECGRLRVGNNV